MAPTISNLATRAVAMGEHISHISKRSEQYETWQIVLLTLIPSLIAVSLAAYCVHQRIRLHRLYKEKKKTHPLLREREFAKMSKLTRAARRDTEEMERSIMIQKSLASRSSLVSTTCGSGAGDQGSIRSVPKTFSSSERSSLRNVDHLAITIEHHSLHSTGDFFAFENQQQQPDNRPRTAGSRGLGPVPPSPLSQVMVSPILDSIPVSPLVPASFASPLPQARRVSSSGSARPASKSVGSQEAAAVNTTGSRRASLPTRPKLVGPDAHDSTQTRPPSSVY